MKKPIIIISSILFSLNLFFILGCDNQNLGNNYYYLPEYEAIDVGYPGGAIIYKSPQKYLFNDIKIYGNVINVKYNDNFIIAIQKTDSSFLKKNIQNINKKDSLRYFIIVKESDIVYGPYNKNEYLQKRYELGILEDL